MIKKLYSLIALVTMAVAAMLFAVSASATPGDPHKTTICHATHSVSNPYVEITVDDASLVHHQNHQDREDIIPAPADGCPGPVTTTTAPATTTTLPATTTTLPPVTTTLPVTTTIPDTTTTLLTTTVPVATTLPPTTVPATTVPATTVPVTEPPPPPADTPTTVGTEQPPAPAPGFALPATPVAPKPLALTGMNTADWTAAGLLMIVTGAFCLRARRQDEG